MLRCPYNPLPDFLVLQWQKCVIIRTIPDIGDGEVDKTSSDRDMLFASGLTLITLIYYYRITLFLARLINFD